MSSNKKAWLDRVRRDIISEKDEYQDVIDRLYSDQPGHFDPRLVRQMAFRAIKGCDAALDVIRDAIRQAEMTDDAARDLGRPAMAKPVRVDGAAGGYRPA